MDGWRIKEVLPLSVIPIWRAVEEHNQEAEQRSHTWDAAERHTRCVGESEEAEELRGHSVEMLRVCLLVSWLCEDITV